MSKLLFAAVAACVVAAPAFAADAAKPYDFSGGWHSAAGAIHIEQTGVALKAAYVNPDGKIVATVTGRTADGYWMTASPSKHRCATERDGVRYWGHIRFTADASGKNFTGRVGSCEDELNAKGSSRKWSAKRD
jgi:hypothetical protein